MKNQRKLTILALAIVLTTGLVLVAISNLVDSISKTNPPTVAMEHNRMPPSGPKSRDDSAAPPKKLEMPRMDRPEPMRRPPDPMRQGGPMDPSQPMRRMHQPPPEMEMPRNPDHRARAHEDRPQPPRPMPPDMKNEPPRRPPFLPPGVTREEEENIREQMMKDRERFMNSPPPEGFFPPPEEFFRDRNGGDYDDGYEGGPEGSNDGQPSEEEVAEMRAQYLNDLGYDIAEEGEMPDEFYEYEDDYVFNDYQ